MPHPPGRALLSKLLAFFQPVQRQRLEALRPRLHRLARSWCHDGHLADDLAQEAIARALGRAAQLRDPEALEPWLFSILNNCWRDWLRRLKPSVPMEELDEALHHHEATPEDHYSSSQAARRVREGIARLPLGQRQVLTLVDLEELGYAQVAAILGVPVGTVMSRLARARRALRGHLECQTRIDASPNVRRFK